MAEKPRDGDLIRQSVEEPDLFIEIFNAHYSAIFGFVSGALDRQRAEDISSEVFFRAFRDRHRFDPTYESARPWLYGIASNLVRDHLRQRARRSRAYERSATRRTVDAGFEDEIVARVDAVGARPVLKEALMALRPEEASVVLLYVAGHKSYLEIAEILNIPIGTVRSRLSRAKQSLRNSVEHIDDQDMGPR